MSPQDTSLALGELSISIGTDELAKIVDTHCPACGAQAMWLNDISPTVGWLDRDDFEDLVKSNQIVVGGRYHALCEQCGQGAEGFVVGVGVRNDDE